MYIHIFLSILRNNYIFSIRRGCFQADNSSGIFTGDFKALDRFIALMKSELVPVQLYLKLIKLPLFVDWIIIYDNHCVRSESQQSIVNMPFASLSPRPIDLGKKDKVLSSILALFEPMFSTQWCIHTYSTGTV
jgi:hypothetical protein